MDLYPAIALATTSYIPNTQQNPTPGITWNSRCSPCPHGARKATLPHVECLYLPRPIQSAVCPCKIAGKPPQGQLCLCGVFILKTHKIPHRCRAHPFKEGIFVVFTAHPHDSTCFHTVLNLQEDQRSVAHLRTQPLQYAVLLNLHDRTLF